MKKDLAIIVWAIFFILFIFGIIFFCLSEGHAATITAKSLSQSDVQSAVTSAANGDTVQLPAGSGTWSAKVSVSKPLKIIGTGVNSTTIHNSTSGDNNALFQIQLNVDQRIEIGSMKLVADAQYASVGIILLNGQALLTQIVLHDLTFDHQKFAIMNGTVGDSAGYGVMYNCVFDNCKIASRQAGFHNTGMLHNVTVPSPAWGTDKYFVYEDCVFNYPSGFYAFYSGDTEGPFNYMVRHCTFNVGGTGSDQSGWDQHGDNKNGGVNAFINTQGYVIHDNVWAMPQGYVIDKLTDTRGGVGNLIYNNSSTGGGRFSRNVIRANAYGNDTTTTAPTQTYYSNNKSNGVDMGDPQIDTNPANSNPNAPIKKGVNFFVNQMPTGYAEIAYPHPLRSGGGTPTPTPTPPSVQDGTVIPVGIGNNALTAKAGTYKLIGTVTAPSGDQDSLWIDFDNDPSGDDTKCWDITAVATPQEQEVNWRSANPKTWTLTAGVHTLNIGQREPATISKVKFLAVGNPSPTPSPTATPTPTPAPTPTPTPDAPTYKNWEQKLNQNTNQWIDTHPPVPD